MRVYILAKTENHYDRLIEFYFVSFINGYNMLSNRYEYMMMPQLKYLYANDVIYGMP